MKGPMVSSVYLKPKKRLTGLPRLAKKGGVQMKEEKDLLLEYTKIMPKCSDICKTQNNF